MIVLSFSGNVFLHQPMSLFALFNAFDLEFYFDNNVDTPISLFVCLFALPYYFCPALYFTIFLCPFLVISCLKKVYNWSSTAVLLLQIFGVFQFFIKINNAAMCPSTWPLT